MTLESVRDWLRSRSTGANPTGDEYIDGLHAAYKLVADTLEADPEFKMPEQIGALAKDIETWASAGGRDGSAYDRCARRLRELSGAGP